MSGPFHSLSISGSGLNTFQTWLDAIADNVANVNTATSTEEEAFRERLVVVRPRVEDGRPSGVHPDRVELGDPEGLVVYNPDHPLADENGQIRMPGFDLAQQMANMLVAQRAYQANASAFRSAREAYQRALEIGS
ncbi:MAG: flagellar basal body rod C-terminal domain-containing protein [Actinomycetota bacterium]